MLDGYALFKVSRSPVRSWNVVECVYKRTKDTSLGEFVAELTAAWHAKYDVVPEAKCHDALAAGHGTRR